MGDPRHQPAIKICGLKDLDQAMAIASMGVNAIGVIGVEGTPRHLAEHLRRNMFVSLAATHPSVNRVWVVADLEDKDLDTALKGEGVPSVVQLHGSESPERCQQLKQRHPQVQWWKALRLRQSEDLERLRPFGDAADALLLDAWTPSQLGGTGHRLPLEWLKDQAITGPWWLAGGISAEWVPTVLERLSPNGLDASSRLEIRPGWKDLSKVRDLVEAVSNVHR